MAKKTKKSAKPARFAKFELLLLALAGILYVNTLSNDYALDDKIVISNNQFTQQGFGGIIDHLTNESFVGFFGTQKELVAGARYRPLSLITFSIENALVGNAPGFSHFINLLLYALTVLVLFRWLIQLTNENKAAVGLAFVAVLLFAVHPLHTEVIANIKGRDDLLAFLFAILAGSMALRADAKSALWSGLYFFLALMSKESAIAFVIILPLFSWVFNTSDNPVKWKAFVPIIAATVAFLAIRFAVVGFPKSEVADQLMNNPFLEMKSSEKYATIVYTLGQYLKLSFLPYPLTHDYYPYHISIMTWSSVGVIVSLISIIALSVLGVIGLVKKKVWGLGIAVFFIGLGLTSNVLFPVGVFMSERFAYISTLGWALGGAWVFRNFLFKESDDWKRIPSLGKASLIVYLSAFSILTVARNRAWKNDDSLVLADLETSSESARINFTYGKMSYLEALQTPNIQERTVLFKRSLKYLQKSEQIDPTLPDTYNLLAMVGYYLNRDPQDFVQNYLRLLELNRAVDIQIMLKNIQELTKDDGTGKQLAIYEGLYPVLSESFDLNMILATTYARILKKYNPAIPYYQKALELNPDNTAAQQDLALIYFEQGRYLESIAQFKKMLAQNPNNKQAQQSLIQAYLSAELPDSANYYRQQFQ